MSVKLLRLKVGVQLLNTCATLTKGFPSNLKIFCTSEYVRNLLLETKSNEMSSPLKHT